MNIYKAHLRSCQIAFLLLCLLLSSPAEAGIATILGICAGITRRVAHSFTQKKGLDPLSIAKSLQQPDLTNLNIFSNHALEQSFLEYLNWRKAHFPSSPTLVTAQRNRKLGYLDYIRLIEADLHALSPTEATLLNKQAKGMTLELLRNGAILIPNFNSEPLSPRELMRHFVSGVYPLQVTSTYRRADNTTYSPLGFFHHDITHAFAQGLSAFTTKYKHLKDPKEVELSLQRLNSIFNQLDTSSLTPAVAKEVEGILFEITHEIIRYESPRENDASVDVSWHSPTLLTSFKIKTEYNSLLRELHRVWAKSKERPLTDEEAQNLNLAAEWLRENLK